MAGRREPNRDIGRSILEKQADRGWGSRVIDRLSADLRETLPEMKGFSPRNLKYMRSFAAALPEELQSSLPTIAEIEAELSRGVEA